MSELVSYGVEVADQRLRVLSFEHLAIVPGQVVTEVDIDRSVPIESDQRSFLIVENVESLRVHSKHFPDRVENLAD